MSVSPLLIGIYGPTASGKSALAEKLAVYLSAQLVSADAFQVYRGFDIGTAKPSKDLGYLGIDIADPTEQFGVGQWIRTVLPHLESAFQAGQNVILVGGTGLYLRALLEEYSDMQSEPDEALREELQQRLKSSGIEPLLEELDRLSPGYTVDRNNPIRITRALEKLKSNSPFQFSLPPFVKKKFAIIPPVEITDSSIQQRLRAMMELGFVEEVEGLINSGVPIEAPAFRAIGYQSILQLVSGDVNREESFEAIVSETRRYAKRQRTWLRSEPNLHILGGSTNSELVAEVQSLLL